MMNLRARKHLAAVVLAAATMVLVPKVFAQAATDGAAPTERGGEDFPFFCSIYNSHGSETATFRVDPDLSSHTGYTMTLWQRLRLRARIPVNIEQSDNGRYWVVRGRARQPLNFLLDNMVLAFVARQDGISSHADTQVAWHNECIDCLDWSLGPMSCHSH